MSLLRLFAPALRVIPYAIPIVVGVLVIRKLSEAGSYPADTAPKTGPTPRTDPKTDPKPTPRFDSQLTPPFDPYWLTRDVVALARSIRDSRDFGALPILADALQEAGCNDAVILDHCRKARPSASESWVVDRILAAS